MLYKSFSLGINTCSLCAMEDYCLTCQIALFRRQRPESDHHKYKKAGEVKSVITRDRHEKCDGAQEFPEEFSLFYVFFSFTLRFL